MKPTNVTPLDPFHPDLRRARFLPSASVGPRSLRVVRALTRLSTRWSKTQAEVVQVAPGVAARVYRPVQSPPAPPVPPTPPVPPAPRTPSSPRTAPTPTVTLQPEAPRPALLWMHGGGLVIGAAAFDDEFCRQVADQLGVVVVSVDYRLAPEHPYPTPLEDCYLGLRWLAAQPEVDQDRIAVGGNSAGGGLAVALTLLARQRGEIGLTFQLLSYPMIDDRSSDRIDIAPRQLRMWNQNSNRYGWTAYLGPAATDATGEVSPLAVPARAKDLTGLPPAWIGVGTRDLFHDEDVAYAHRLRAAGVPCALHEVPGAYHGFDLIEATAAVSREFRRAQIATLSAALTVPAPRQPDSQPDQPIAADPRLST
ncbi:alpha/beta hydrolase [Frankia sp. AiPa1]|uniref:alpha/beta hydrolase n=1 Tax=Frankia sp. AiPa1 TaxID=573492 RepID=UPI00202B94FB|nr:alpha/beta hydrolase [Frankia sp. AiPa1]MCL9762708.1 alpha/beta hydrolase [Frankia sp. AiPa1]